MHPLSGHDCVFNQRNTNWYGVGAMFACWVEQKKTFLNVCTQRAASKTNEEKANQTKRVFILKHAHWQCAI